MQPVCNIVNIINCAFYINNKHVLRQGSRSSWEQTDSCLNFWSISKLQPIWISCNSYRYVLCFPSYLSSKSWHSYNDLILWLFCHFRISRYKQHAGSDRQLDDEYRNSERFPGVQAAGAAGIQPTDAGGAPAGKRLRKQQLTPALG